MSGHRILRPIGRGAHGTVYLAKPMRDGRNGRLVALKLVTLLGGAGGAKAQAKFMHSAETMRRLQHPDIVTLLDAGVEDRLGWLAMEAVPGVDLGRYTGCRRLLPEPAVLVLGQRIALALAYAHQEGVVHRDLKPGNVLVDWDRRIVKLADFDLARSADALQTGTGIVPGTPSYMAPELLAGALPTPSSDLYALGVLLYELLSGQLPHQAASMGDLLRRVATEPAPDLKLLNPGLPAAVAALVARLLARQPGSRPASGEVVAEILGALAAGFSRAP